MEVSIPSPCKHAFSDLKVISSSKAVSTHQGMKVVTYNIIDKTLAKVFTIKEGDLNHGPFLIPILVAIQSGMVPHRISNPVLDAGFIANPICITSTNHDIPIHSCHRYDFKCFTRQNKDFTMDNFGPLWTLLETLMNISLYICYHSTYVYIHLSYCLSFSGWPHTQITVTNITSSLWTGTGLIKSLLMHPTLLPLTSAFN